MSCCVEPSVYRPRLAQPGRLTRVEASEASSSSRHSLCARRSHGHGDEAGEAPRQPRLQSAAAARDGPFTRARWGARVPNYGGPGSGAIGPPRRSTRGRSPPALLQALGETRDTWKSRTESLCGSQRVRAVARQGCPDRVGAEVDGLHPTIRADQHLSGAGLAGSGCHPGLSAPSRYSNRKRPKSGTSSTSWETARCLSSLMLRPLRPFRCASL